MITESIYNLRRNDTNDFKRRKKFYDKFLNDLDLLDKKYLITEMLEKPNFYDGEILYDALYEIDKSMAERIKEYSLSIADFKEYIEMWIHEVKLPLASMNLMVHNHKELSDKKIVEQLKRIDDDVEQVLYYVRSENAEKAAYFLLRHCDGRFAAFKHAGDATDYTASGGGSGLWHVHQDDGEQRNRPGGD